MNWAEAKILFVISCLEQVTEKILAVSSLLEKGEFEDSLFFLEKQKLIEKSETGTYSLSNQGRVKIDEFTKSYSKLKLTIRAVYLQTPSHLWREADGSLVFIDLVDFDGNALNTYKMGLRTVISKEAQWRVNGDVGSSIHWVSVKNFERFVLEQCPDFQLIYSSRNNLVDFEVNLPIPFSTELPFFLLSKLSIADIELAFKKKATLMEQNERNGEPEKNTIGLLTDADFISTRLMAS